MSFPRHGTERIISVSSVMEILIDRIFSLCSASCLHAAEGHWSFTNIGEEVVFFLSYLLKIFNLFN